MEAGAERRSVAGPAIAPRPPPGRPKLGLLEPIAVLLEVSPTVLQRAHSIFTALGEAGRRRMLERLSVRPHNYGDGFGVAGGMKADGVYRRLRYLKRNSIVTRCRPHIYKVDPEYFRCASAYIDMLMVTASLSARGYVK